MPGFYSLLNKRKKSSFAYEEKINPLSLNTVFFQYNIRSENPETFIAKKNGKKRNFPQRTGDQEYP